MIEKMCARGAILLATGVCDETGEYAEFDGDDISKSRTISGIAEDALLAQINITSSKTFHNVPNWNDTVAENADQVREQMLLAAKNIRNSIEIS